METNKLRIIFLDFDGVIDGSWSKYCLDPNKIVMLEEILKATGAKIVVSSSWAVGCKDASDFIDKTFGNWKSLTAKADKDSLFIKSIIDVTDHKGRCRGDEIQRWLDSHEDEVESYVILDDDSDMLDEQLFNFVQTDGWYGISNRTVSLSIQVLNNEKIFSPMRLNQELMFKWRLKCRGYGGNIGETIKEYYNKFDK